MAERRSEQFFKGISASPGVAHGRAFVFVPKDLKIPSHSVAEAEIEQEIERFEEKLLETRQEVLALRDAVSDRLGQDSASIFDAHLLVLEDRALIEESIREMRESGRNITFCVNNVAQRYIDTFSNIDDEYLRERANDIRDVTKRLLHNLVGEVRDGLGQLSEGRIVVSRDISPSDTAAIEKGKVLAFVTDAGSKTSHAVIMARSIQVPAVVGMRDFLHEVRDGDEVLVDGYDGTVVLNPSDKTLFGYGKLEEQKKVLHRQILSEAALPARTKDGVDIALRANIEGPEEIGRIKDYGAAGVGLFRTEYLFLEASGFPGEDEQFEAYRRVASEIAPAPVVIRTLDLGGDKFPNSVYPTETEANPFLGLRAIRLCLESPEVFKIQLRAILRASAHGKVRLMYPMISGVAELERANDVLGEARNELDQEGVPYDRNMEVGAMIEIPSAAITADLLARKCDFFSIGTNDLIQYLLAIDRLNERIAHLYEPTHPAVLRMISYVVQAARQENIRVSVCGEIAGDAIMVPVLLGLGVDELSLVASGLPAIKYLLRSLDMTAMRELADNMLQGKDTAEVLEMAEQFYESHVAHLIA